MLRLNYDCLDEVEDLVDYVDYAISRENVCAEYKARMMFIEWLVSRFKECVPEDKIMSALSNFKSKKFDSEYLFDNGAIVFEDYVEDYITNRHSKCYLIFPVRLDHECILIGNAQVVKTKEKIKFDDMYCFYISLKHSIPKYYEFSMKGIELQPKKLIFYVMSSKYYFVRWLYIQSLRQGRVCAG